MNKLFTKIAALALGAAMAFGVGVAANCKAKDVKPTEAAGSTATYTVASASSVTPSGNPSGSSHSFSTNGSINSGAIQLAGKTAVKNFTLTLSGYGGKKITALSVNAKSNKSSGNGALTLVAGSTTLADSSGYKNFNHSFWYGAWSQSEVTCNITLSNSSYAIGNNESVTLTITNNANSIYIYSVSFTYEAAATKTPSSVSSSGHKTSFDDGETFSYGGTLTVTYTDSTTAPVSPASYKYGASGINPTSTGTVITTSTTLSYNTHNGQYIYVLYTENNTTVYTSYQISVSQPPTYTSVTVQGGSVVGTDVGSAYIQCSATATGTNIPASPTFTWYVTETNTYDTTTSVSGKASIDTTGKVTFLNSCTVYVWALAPDGTTHNSSGYEAVATGLKGGQTNPYSVTEAKAIADALTNGTNNGHIVYCIGKVTSVGGSHASKATDPATFTIADLNDSTKTLLAFSIQNGSESDPTATNYVAVDYEVLIFGYLIKYNNTSEIGFVNSDLDSSGFVYSHAPASIDSIAVKTAPSKTAYKSGESFDAAGLIITVTYTDASTDDIAYSDSPASFSFSPATITAAGNVTITYQGKTCTQAVTLVSVTNVTGVASAPSEVYKDGSIDPDDVTLNVTYSDSTSGTVKATSVSCDTSAIATGVTATATYSPATGTKTATFTVDVVKEPVYDTVVDELVVGDTGITGTTYGPWSGVTKTSGAVYAGNTNENNNGGIGMRADTSKDPSGIWVTSSSGVATKVEVVWTTTTSRTLYVFGKDTAYTGANHYSEMQGTQIGSFSYSSTSVDLSEECQYIALCVTGGAAGFSKIRITWKVEGADYPLTANPTLSTGAAASVAVGKNLALGVTTTPSNSDERLIVTSSNENYVTVSGSGKAFTIHGVAIGSATVTVKGVKGAYQSTTTITVTAAVKTYEDKILDTTSLDITSYSTDTSISHTNDGVDYTCYNVMKTNGIQFKSSPAGYISNKEVLYSGSTTAIKSITLIMNSHNTGYITAYEGTSADPDQDVCELVGTWDATGVNTYTLSSGMTYFKLLASGTTNVDKIIIELVDDADSVLGEARLAALAILTDLSGLCGGDDAPGYVSQSDWDTLTSDLTELNLSADAKQFLKDAERIALDNLSQGGAEIENAMAHYDACVTKFHYTPFAGITNAQPSGVANPLSLLTNNSGTEVAIIVVTSMIGLSAVGGYFFLRKRKENI